MLLGVEIFVPETEFFVNKFYARVQLLFTMSTGTAPSIRLQPSIIH